MHKVRSNAHQAFRHRLDLALLQLMAISDSTSNWCEMDPAELHSLVERARYRGVEAVIAKKLRHLPSMTNQLKQELYQTELTVRLRDLALSGCISRLADEFSNSKLKYLIYKGSVLWRVLGADGPVKLSNDVDVMVFPEDVGLVNNILRSLGYECRVVKGSEATYVSQNNPDIDLHLSMAAVKCTNHGGVKVYHP